MTTEQKILKFKLKSQIEFYKTCLTGLKKLKQTLWVLGAIAYTKKKKKELEKQLGQLEAHCGKKKKKR